MSDAAADARQPSGAGRLVVQAGYGFGLLASFFYGWSITFKRGEYIEPAMMCVTVAVLVVVTSFVDAARRPQADTSSRARFVTQLAWVGLLGLLFSAWNDREILWAPVKPWALGRMAQQGFFLLLLTYVPFLGDRKEPRWLSHARFAAFAVLVALAGYETIRTVPAPAIDVWTVQMSGAAHLEQGQNPFQQVAMRDTGPRVAVDVPYVYPPLQLFLTIPGHILGRDVRFTMVGAILLTGILLRQIGRGRSDDAPSMLADAPALFLWLTPKLWYIVEQSWVDPVQICLITSMTWVALRGNKTHTGIALGIVLAAKQTMFWFFPVMALTYRLGKRELAIAVAVAAATVLPFVVWDFAALKHANFDFVNQLPPRPDALTFNNWVRLQQGPAIPGALGFLLAAVACGITSWRLRHKPELAALGILATYSVFFFFNKWAFANYYYSLTGLSVLAAAMYARARAVT